MVSYLALFGTLFIVPYYLSAEHDTATLIGLQLAVLPVAIGITAPIAGRLVNRVRTHVPDRRRADAAASGMLEIAVRHGTAGTLTGLALTGLGLGLFTPANNAAVMSASPPGHAGVTGGMLNMTRGLGTALGVALAGALFTAGRVPPARTGPTRMWCRPGTASRPRSASRAGHARHRVLPPS